MRRTPWTPVFDTFTRTGTILPGNTPASIPLPSLTFVAFLDDAESSLLQPVDLALDGDTLYVVNQIADALVVADVTTPASPSVTGAIDTSLSSGTMNSVSVVAYGASHCYTMASVSGTIRFQVVDVSTPASPSLVGTLANAVFNAVDNHPCFVGSHVYLAVRTADRIASIDVSTKASPSVAGSVTDATDLNGPLRLAASGSTLFATCADGGGLTSVDISTPASPAVISRLTDGTLLTVPIDIAISGSLAYVTDLASDSLVIVDISNPAAMSIVGSTNDSPLKDPFRVSVNGDYAFVRCAVPDLVALVDISDSANPTVLDSLEAAGMSATSLFDVAADADGYVYVSCVGSPDGVAVLQVVNG